MGPGRLPSPSGAGGNRRLLWSLALTLAVLFVLDLLLPRNIPLLPYYFLVVVLSAGFLTPRQMAPLIVAAYGLAISSGIYWGFFPSIDFISRLVGLSGVTAVALLLSAQRCREVARRRRSEQILNLTLENAASGVGLADAQGRIFRVNPALCAMLGRDATTLQTLSWAEITHPDDIAREHSLVEEMRANRCNSYRLRKRYLRADGSPIWMDVSVSCVRLPDGGVDFFIGQAMDITNEVVAQQQLQRRATTDSLTALLNREEAFNRIQQLTVLDQRHGQELAVLFCDLDRFKSSLKNPASPAKMGQLPI